jgi:y4mF family transcriptional regulator
MQTINKPPRTGTPRARRRSTLRSDRRLVNEIADQVRKARIASKLTQSDLAGLSNTGVRFIIDLEHGKPTIEFGKAIDVLTTLGLTLRVERIQGVLLP